MNNTERNKHLLAAQHDAEIYISDGLWDGNVENSIGWATTAFEIANLEDWGYYWSEFKATLENPH